MLQQLIIFQKIQNFKLYIMLKQIKFVEHARIYQKIRNLVLNLFCLKTKKKTINVKITNIDKCLHCNT